MRTVTRLLLTTIVVASLWSPAILAQSGTEERSLGDLARALRKGRKAPLPVITNENFSQMPRLIRETEQRAQATIPADPPQQVEVKPQEPAATCSLAFSANGLAPQNTPVPLATLDLPENELAKLDGPAVIAGDTLQVSVYNGTKWELREITVGLTIVKRDNRAAAQFGTAQLLPASAGAGPVPMLKKPDITLLYHMKGSAAPFSTTAFKEALGLNLGSNDEWHWAILQARGIPPK